MKKITILAILLFAEFIAFSQKRQLAAVTGHYETLQQFSNTPNSSRAWMDTIKYPPAEYGASIVYLLIKPYYLSESEVNALTESVNFPANSSNQTREELNYLIDLQSKRTPKQIQRVEYLANIGYWPSANLISSHNSYQQNLKDLFFMGREILGESVSAKTSPKISRLLQGVMQDMRLMEFTIKYHHLRPRPYHLEPQVHSLARINSPAFVNGHTLWAFLQAFTWSEIVPEKQSEFVALAEEIRRSREIMGIHYPSDNEGARQVADRMLRYYFKNNMFLRDFKEAVAEWKAISTKR
jgi:acid phosphatase (class A)